MKVYYYKYMDFWLTCRAKNKREIARMFENSESQPDAILTEREAEKRAERGDHELADCIAATFMCSLMCN